MRYRDELIERLRYWDEVIERLRYWGWVKMKEKVRDKNEGNVFMNVTRKEKTELICESQGLSNWKCNVSERRVK